MGAVRGMDLGGFFLPPVVRAGTTTGELRLNRGTPRLRLSKATSAPLLNTVQQHRAHGAKMQKGGGVVLLLSPPKTFCDVASTTRDSERHEPRNLREPRRPGVCLIDAFARHTFSFDMYTVGVKI